MLKPCVFRCVYASRERRASGEGRQRERERERGGGGVGGGVCVCLHRMLKPLQVVAKAPVNLVNGRFCHHTALNPKKP